MLSRALWGKDPDFYRNLGALVALWILARGSARSSGAVNMKRQKVAANEFTNQGHLDVSIN
jgi:hypothetical protein